MQVKIWTDKPSNERSERNERADRQALVICWLIQQLIEARRRIAGLSPRPLTRDEFEQRLRRIEDFANEF